MSAQLIHINDESSHRCHVRRNDAAFTCVDRYIFMKHNIFLLSSYCCETICSFNENGRNSFTGAFHSSHANECASDKCVDAQIDECFLCEISSPKWLTRLAIFSSALRVFSMCVSFYVYLSIVYLCRLEVHSSLFQAKLNCTVYSFPVVCRNTVFRVWTAYQQWDICLHNAILCGNMYPSRCWRWLMESNSIIQAYFTCKMTVEKEKRPQKTFPVIFLYFLFSSSLDVHVFHWDALLSLSPSLSFSLSVCLVCLSALVPTVANWRRQRKQRSKWRNRKMMRWLSWM